MNGEDKDDVNSGEYDPTQSNDEDSKDKEDNDSDNNDDDRYDTLEIQTMDDDANVNKQTEDDEETPRVCDKTT